MARSGVLGGLEGFLGSFGRAILSGLQSIGGSIADAIGLGRQAGLSPIPEIVAQEWGQVKVVGERESEFASLRPWESPTHDMFEDRSIPWNKRYAYTVAVYGRDMSTGRFSHQEYNITVSRELTVEEITNETRTRLGSGGQSPTMEMFDVKLIGASKWAEDTEW
jgi:hypothetical protein